MFPDCEKFANSLKSVAENCKDKLAAEQLSPEALLVEMIVKNGWSMKEAVKKLADDPGNGYSKNALYEAGLRLKEMF